MAKKRTSRKKDLTKLATAAVGGFAGGQLTNILTNKVQFLATNPMYAPAATFAIGMTLATGSKNQSLRSLGEGAAIVAGTELMEKLVVRFMKPGTNGNGAAPVNGPKNRYGVNLVR